MKGLAVTAKRILVGALLITPFLSAVAAEQLSETARGDQPSFKVLAIVQGQHREVALTESGELLVASEGSAWRRVARNIDTFFRGLTYAQGQFIAVSGSYARPSAVIAASTDGEHWTIRRAGVKSVLTAVTYGAGQFVVVGDHGLILSSADGIDWQARPSRTRACLASVAFGNDTFVVVGEDGACLVSSDARNWTSQCTHTTQYLGSVQFDGVFSVRARQTVLVSSTGRDWADAPRTLSSK